MEHHLTKTSQMPFDTAKDYTIHDGEENVIELKSIRKVENWFQGKIKSCKLSDSLEEQFNEIEIKIKERDFKTVHKIENQILSHDLVVKELGQKLSEIQMGKKDTIYFKITD